MYILENNVYRESIYREYIYKSVCLYIYLRKECIIFRALAIPFRTEAPFYSDNTAVPWGRSRQLNTTSQAASHGSLLPWLWLFGSALARSQLPGVADTGRQQTKARVRGPLSAWVRGSQPWPELAPADASIQGVNGKSQSRCLSNKYKYKYIF